MKVSGIFTMNFHFYLLVAAIIMLGTAVLLWWRWRAETVDWELYVAFIRREFPPQQRATAQEIAARIAPIVGFGIKGLRPEHTLRQILEWSHDSISAQEFATAFSEEFGIATNADTTFRVFVEEVVLKRQTDRPGTQVLSNNRLYQLVSPLAEFAGLVWSA